jgi:hypothetical protein
MSSASKADYKIADLLTKLLKLMRILRMNKKSFLFNNK